MKTKAAKAWTAILATAAVLTLACGGGTAIPALPTQPPTVFPAQPPTENPALRLAPTRQPTLTLQPTVTPRPTPTPQPTPTPAPQGICGRSPTVQDAIMDAVNAASCDQVTPNQLAGIAVLRLKNAQRPGDPAGLRNLLELHHHGPLGGLNLRSAPNLRRLTLDGVDHWPRSFMLPPLPRLKRLEITMQGAAACSVHRPEPARRIFANLLRRLSEIEVRLYLRLPYRETDETPDQWRPQPEQAITAALTHNLETLFRQRYGYRPGPARTHPAPTPRSIR